MTCLQPVAGEYHITELQTEKECARVTNQGPPLGELTEETGLRGGRIEPLVVVAFDYPDRSVRLHVFLVRDPEGEVVTDGEREWRWADRATLERLEMPEANRPILRALAWRLSS